MKNVASKDTIFYILNVLVPCYSSCCLYCHSLGGTWVPCPPLHVLSGLSFPVFSCCLVEVRWRCGGGGGRVWGGGEFLWCDCVWGFPFLPEEGQSRPIFPLQSLHTDSVCRYARTSNAPEGDSHQCDGDPTRDVSTRLWIGLLPLWCEATGYPFQGSCRLHPRSPSTEATKGEKCRRCWRQASRYICFLPFSASSRHFSGVLPQ